MNEGTFELHKPGWYTPQNVEENEYLNNLLEDDKYGIWYSVKFEGDAETYITMAKSAPVAGQKVYGHIDLTAKGKPIRFKKDKVPEGQPNPSGQASHSTDENIARSVALKAAVDFVNNEATTEFTLTVAEDFLAWLKGQYPINTSKAEPKRDWGSVGKGGSEPLPTPPEDEDY